MGGEVKSGSRNGESIYSQILVPLDGGCFSWVAGAPKGLARPSSWLLGKISLKQAGCQPISAGVWGQCAYWDH